ncbi:MAG: hypothetical protein K6T80_02190 [Firmicutes bacterium]|nr:hypothetical protein [Bacillota bacterium]
MTGGLKERLFNKGGAGIPRGELWISGAVLRELGLPLKQESFIALSAGIGADLCFFSYTGPVQNIPAGSAEMERNIKKAHDRGLLCGVTVDGPFQRAVKEHGFIEIMRGFYDGARLEKYIAAGTAPAAAELQAAEKAGADLLILCDDIAYSRGLYFSPRQFAAKILPFYHQLRDSVKETTLGFHSDGKVEPVLDSLLAAGFSVFSLEPEAMNLIDLARAFPAGTILLSGIKSEWLLGAFSPADLPGEEIIRYVDDLKSNCNLILASLCGLTDVNGLNRLKELYKLFA